MQTKEQCLAKILEMVTGTPERLLAKAEQLFKSGGVDPERCEDNYILPKILLVAALKHEIDAWMPLGENKAARKAIANLKHF